MNIIDDYYPDKSCSYPKVCVGGKASSCSPHQCPEENGPPWHQPEPGGPDFDNLTSDTYVIHGVMCGWNSLVAVNNSPGTGKGWLGAFSPTTGRCVGTYHNVAYNNNIEIPIIGTAELAVGEAPFFKYWTGPYANGRPADTFQLTPCGTVSGTFGRIPTFSGDGRRHIIDFLLLVHGAKYTLKGNYYKNKPIPKGRV